MISKYKMFLNILLIILLISGISIVTYILYDYISNYFATKEAEKVVNLFEEYVTTGDANENTNSAVIVDVGNDQNDETNVQTQQQNTNNSSVGTGVKHKGYTIIGSIQIPKTKIKYPIVDIINPNAMTIAVTAIYGPGLNEIGNTVLIAHNYRNGTFFSNNKKLAIGDKIYITDSTGNKVEYEIYNTYQAQDSDFSYATRNTGGKREISLSTCTTDATKRLVIWAKEV